MEQVHHTRALYHEFVIVLKLPRVPPVKKQR